MELTMTNNFGFCELNENEMMMVDGGAITTNVCRAIVSATVGAVAGTVVQAVCAPLGPASIAAGVIVANIVSDKVGKVISTAIIG